MTRRRKLENHYQSLIEIREIMNSMKTLAYMESHKIDQCIKAQQTVISSIETAARDLVSFHPEIIPQPDGDTVHVFIIIGAERGFCGDFNQALHHHLESDVIISAHSALDTGHIKLIPVGQKLFTLFENDMRVLSVVDGASVAEDIPNTLQKLVAQLVQLQQQQGVINVSCCYHQTDDMIVSQQILPPFQEMASQSPLFSYPPLLTVAVEDLFEDISDHFLLAVLHQILYVSLMAENDLRVSHLEAAIRHLDDQCDALKRQSATLRQEEIVEEIEVILLSATSLTPLPDQ